MPLQLIPVSWLIGTWRGVGVGGYPTVRSSGSPRRVAFTELPGKPFPPTTSSRSWLLDDDGNEVRPLAQETGYWRPEADGAIELLLSHPTGYVEVWVGTADRRQGRA